MKIISKGTAASKGLVEGTAFVVKNKKDIFRFKAGSILITRMTDPSFVPAMMNSIGVITDIGGVTCHAAIISRELGIPCIVGTKNATEKIVSGQKLVLDANKGVVYEK